MRKTVQYYLILTFLIMTLCWGTCVVCSIFGLSLSECPLLYVPYVLGGWSPTIASFFALKRATGLTFRAWLQSIFDFKHSIFSYLMMLILAVVFILLLSLLSGYESGAPLFAVVFMVPMMLFGGGLEETGWRGVLQLALESKLSFTFSTLITAAIWCLWHLPLFFIRGVSQYGANYAVFSLNVMGLSFALSAIRKCTGSTWLCVLFHCLVNSLQGVYIIHENIVASGFTTAVLVLLSYLLVCLQKRKHIFR